MIWYCQKLYLPQIFFLVADTQLYKRLCPSVGRSVGWSVTLELKSGKTRISAPAHPSATDGRVSGLVFLTFLVSFSPSLQTVPLNPAWQRQLNEFDSSTHFPYEHGLLWHGCFISLSWSVSYVISGLLRGYEIPTIHYSGYKALNQTEKRIIIVKFWLNTKRS